MSAGVWPMMVCLRDRSAASFDGMRVRVQNAIRWFSFSLIVRPVDAMVHESEPVHLTLVVTLGPSALICGAHVHDSLLSSVCLQVYGR